jgi:hypothetical protein
VSMRVIASILASALLAAGAARGQLSFVLTPAVQLGTATNEIAFTGALTNTGSSNLYLNDIQCVLLSSASNALRADTNAFFANVPGILLSGETYADVVFGVTLGAVAPPGVYNGTITLFGGSNIFASSNLASVSFQLSLPDSVGDGIPDWWRQFYFGGDGSTTNSQSCATCDADGTGQENRFKYIVGLNPTNGNSVFALGVTNGPPAVLSFGPVSAGRLVVPEFSDDLTGGSWQNLVGPVTTQTNHSEFFLPDPDPPTNQRFYRVRISLP